MTATADFSRLPVDALGFFGLPADFDRDALRRSYGKLIRQYKPDTHPEEFQRIRSAYEQLDAELRYGKRQASAATIAHAPSIWELMAATPTASESGLEHRAEAAGQKAGFAPQKTAAPRLAERMATEDPVALYKELNRKGDKTPYDFYALAVLSDLADRGDGLMFLKWLLTGLKQHPQDQGLFQLLKEYLRTDLETTRLPQILVTLSTVVTNDRFYFLSEAAWDRLLRDADFALFRRTLAACEKNLHDFRIGGKLAFYLHLLPAAVWKGDTDWIDQAFSLMEEHAQELDGRAEFELELAGMARRFAGSSSEFVNGNAIRKKIHDALKAYCCQPPMEGLQAVIRCQAEIAADSRGVMEAFPAVDGVKWPEAVTYWRIVSSLVEEEVTLSQSEGDVRKLERASWTVLRELRDEVEPLIIKWVQFRWLVIVGAVGGLIATPCLLLWGLLSGFGMFLFAVSWIVTVIVADRLYLRPTWIEPWLINQLFKRVFAAYRSAWRARIFRHQYAHPVPVPVMVGQLQATGEELGDTYWLNWLIGFLQSDPGFAIYTSALPFLK